MSLSGGLWSFKIGGTWLVFNTQMLIFLNYFWKILSLFFFRFSQSQISVRLGEYDFTTQGETGEQTYTLSGMKMHENYDPKTFENDIAILKLSQDAQFTQSVQPACLPIGDSDYNNVKVNIGTLFL